MDTNQSIVSEWVTGEGCAFVADSGQNNMINAMSVPLMQKIKRNDLANENSDNIRVLDHFSLTFAGKCVHCHCFYV